MNGADGFKEMSLVQSFTRLVGGAALLSGESRTACLDFCEENRALVLGCLPFSLAEFADAAGFALMFDVVLTYGGRKLYLPTRAQKFSDQTGLHLSAHAYARWREHADSNGQLDVPSAWGLFLALRRAAIRFALSSHWPAEALLATFGLTRRQLRASRFNTVMAL